jgi:hypothetical protein
MSLLKELNDMITETSDGTVSSRTRAVVYHADYEKRKKKRKAKKQN